jgi:predicted KAP-like P-loop ATPase
MHANRKDINMLEIASDNPIQEDKDDILGFKNISNKIANDIKAFSCGKETFTMAIEGEWGSGKTSLVNLIEKKIKEKKKDEGESNVTIVHFNPWMISDVEQLTKYFFIELMKEIVRIDFDTKLKENILQDIKAFVKILTPDSVSLKPLGIGVDYKFDKQIKEKTLHELKSTINGYLKEVGKKIVIIIDDIDRLTDKEIETLFRLIKGVADFDNIIYILLYDKQVVAKSLEKFKSERGEKYLDKIVQYTVSIPRPFSGQLAQELDKKIWQILGKLKKDDKKYIFTEYDTERWYVIHENRHIDKYIKNLRDLNKIIAIMSFEYPIVCEDVDFIDYFILALIKLNNIALYNSIKNNPKSYIAIKEMLKEINDIEKEVLENFEKDGRFLKYRELLGVIFPVFSKDDHTSYQVDNIHKSKPLASATYFSNYFAFDPSPNTISHKEYCAIKDLMFSKKQKEFRESIIQLDNEGKSRMFIDMFYEVDFEDLNISDNKLYNVAIDIFSVAYLVQDGVYDEYVELVHVNPDSIYIGFGLDLLGKLRDKKRIDNIFKDKQVSLLTKSYILYCYKKRNKQFLTGEHFNMLDSKIKLEFEKLTLKEILDNKDLNGTKVLHHMKDYGLFDNMAIKLREKIFSSDEWFFKILNLFKYWHKSSSKNRYLINKELLKEVLPIEEIDAYIKNLDIKSLNKEEKELLDIWHREDF